VSFIKKFFSPYALPPLMLGLGSAAFFWFVQGQQDLAKFLASFGGAGYLITVLIHLVAGGKSVSGPLARRRQEMIDGLADLLDTSKFSATPESDRPAAAAQPERA